MKSFSNNIKLLFLLIGMITMTFSGINWQLVITPWIAPIGLLIYTRNSRYRGFILFFILMSIVGFISQTSNNLYNEFGYGAINGLAYGVIFTITYLLDKLLYKRETGFGSTLIFPTVFVSIEFLVTSQIGTQGIVAQSQFYFDPLAQLSTITGMHGISFFVLWFPSIVYWILANGFRKRNVVVAGTVYGILFLLVLVLGFISGNREGSEYKTVKVATISGESDIHALAQSEKSVLKQLGQSSIAKVPERFFASDTEIEFELQKTSEAATNGAKIIVWSEVALVLNHNKIGTLIEKVVTICKQNQAYVLLAFLEEDTSGSPKPFNNKNVLVTPNGDIGWEYLKVHLAPSEVPIVNSGEGKIPFFDTEYGRIGSVICYDLDFPNYIHQASKNDIDIMLVPSFDWETFAELHNKMARFESLQSGFSIIRSNGKGYNLVQNSKGDIVSIMNTFETNLKILYGDLPIQQSTTVYSQIGNLFMFLCLGLLLYFVVIALLQRRNQIR